MASDEKRKPDLKLRKLYPELIDAELILAEDKLAEYREFALRLYRRIAADPDAYRKFDLLTGQQNHLTIDHERSKNKNSPNT
jgi:hypothetical protein